MHNDTSVSFVVLAQSHNPSIINPDWLKGQGIVDSEVGEICEPPITTPAFSRIKYDSGIQIVVEETKLIVSVDGGNEGLYRQANLIAQRYVDVLKHIPYKAIGKNLAFEYEIKSLEFFENVVFSKHTKDVIDGYAEPEIGFSFPILDGDSIANIKLAAREFKSNGGSVASVAVCEVNIHKEFEAQGDVSGFVDCISQYDQHFVAVRELISRLLEK